MERKWYDTPEQLYREVLKIYNDPATKYYNGFSGSTKADGTVEWKLHSIDGQTKVFYAKYAA